MRQMAEMETGYGRGNRSGPVQQLPADAIASSVLIGGRRR
jgi:hypothetical protein